MLRYPPDELSWPEVWKDAYVSAMQIGTADSRAMAELIARHVLNGPVDHSQGEGYMKTWLSSSTSPPASPRAPNADNDSSPPMFDDEDIGVHSYSYRPPAPAPPPPISFPSSHPRPAALLPLSTSRSRPSPSSASSHPAPIDVSDDDIDIDPTPTPSSQPRPRVLPLRPVDEGGGKGRRSKRRGRIPHSPHCSVVGTQLNRPFQCIYPDRVDGRRGGEEEDGGGERKRCGTDFGSRQACENHIRARHTKEKLPCSFDGCVSAFTDFQNLTKHERTSHKNTP